MSKFLLVTVIHTDKLAEVAAFYEQHFAIPMNRESEHAVILFPFPEAAVEFIDAAWAGKPITPGIQLRLSLPHTELERERLIGEGVACGELIVEHWNQWLGENVRFFEFTDPSGTRVQVYEPHYGEKRGLTTTVDGTEARKLAQKNKAGE